MRPLFHPSVEDVTVEGLLHALSDPVRVAILADIVGQDCSQNCSSFLTVHDKVIPKSTLSQHFRALREAGLIRGERRGVEVHNISRCEEIDQRFPGLIRAIVQAHELELSRRRSAAKKPGTKKRVRKPRKATKEFRISSSGLPVFPRRDNRIITSEMVKRALEDDLG